MAFPWMAAVMGGSTLLSLFGKDKPYAMPPTPEFFGKDFETMRTILKQRNQAQYGTMMDDTREALANMGILGNQGATSDIYTRAGIAESQDLFNADAALYGEELGRKRGFETNRYLQGMGLQYQTEMANRDRADARYGKIGDTALALGKYYAMKGMGGSTTDRLRKLIEDIGRQETSPAYPAPGGIDIG